jgi:hypothetical protein
MWGGAVASAAEAVIENRSFIAAVNRSATQKQEQRRVFQQTIEAQPRRSCYRSAEARRHPKTKTKSSFSLGY